MSLKTRIRLSVAALVAAVVVLVSLVYVYDFTGSAIDSAADSARQIAGEVAGYAVERVDQSLVAPPDRPTVRQQVRERVADIIRTDPLIPAMLTRSVSTNAAVLDVIILGPDNHVLTSFTGTFVPGAFRYKSFDTWKNGPPLRNLWQLLTEKENYAIQIPVAARGDKTPQFIVMVVVRSSLIRHTLAPAFENLGYGFLIALAVSLALAWLVPALALRPLARVSRTIDLITKGELLTDGPEAAAAARESREYADVQSKLSVLGQQFHGVRRDALELRNNIDELLERLEEVVMLFDAQGRTVMAGRPAEQLLGLSRDEILRSTMVELFPSGTAVREAIERNEPLRDKIVYVEVPEHGRRRLLLSVELLSRASGTQPIGTLVRLRDPDTRKQLESHLDLSSRLAAISRLTSGVAHEIKNPLNAIALHIEVLRGRLDAPEPELELITHEVRRLDHVVRTFLNFNKPLELELTEVNLPDVVRELAAFIRPDAEAHQIAVETDLCEEAWIRGDPRLLRQAVLNVVVNAIDAMGEQGRLKLAVDNQDGECNVTVADTGPGIPEGIRDRIFDLYFSTKPEGSGIGLALTFRMVQLHGGTIDFESQPGKGTSFRLRFPEAAPAGRGRLAMSQARS
jgi:nitrogen-specific signal transduction histidine kinase